MQTKDFEGYQFLEHDQGFPGPGTYELTATEDKNGFCFVSKFRSSLGAKINSISNHSAS